MKNLSAPLLLLAFLFSVTFNGVTQIYAPEGLNMPGNWDGWTNPPENPVFAGEAQTSGGQLMLLPLEPSVYQTTFQSSSSGDVTPGNYIFKFTSGPLNNIWQNQWGNTTVALNTIQEYAYGVAGDEEPDPNSITLKEDKWYLMNWENTGYESTRAIFMEMDAAPATFESVIRDPLTPEAAEQVLVTVQMDKEPSANENIYLRYSVDGWENTSQVEVTFSGNEGEATLPGQPEETTVSYYVYSTGANNPQSDLSLKTINYDINGGDNYTYTVGETVECGSGINLISAQPVFPQADEPVIITFNAELGNGGLAGHDGDVYAHTGVITSESTSTSDWKYVKTEWGENTDDTKLERLEDNLYELSIDHIRDYYGVPDGESIEKLAMVFRSGEPVNGEQYLEGKATGNQDIFADVYVDGLHVKITYPTSQDPLVNPDQPLPVCASSLNASTMELYIDDELLVTENSSQLTYGLNPSEYAEGSHWLRVVADDGAVTKQDSVLIFIRGQVNEEPLPDGVKAGINYIDDNTVTLVLHDLAGYKDFAFAIGDFNNWNVSEDSYMNVTPDDEYFWLTIDGLTAGEEYAFQYYIDGELKIADPYTEKILDPYNDQYISEETYPDLKPYPFNKTIGNVSVFQTAQEPFNWEVEDFTPAAVNESQSDLIVYEMLIRDFVEDRRIVSVIDTLDYLANLGVNAIELMPFNEFEGNDSWGYNPSFYFAPDKAYGTKEDYKRFIDECHKRGIAVIMDIVLNHSFSQSPFAQMYWNDQDFQPSAQNPYYNEECPHPPSCWGSDFDHTSPYTQALVDSVTSFWLTEYKIDGFRFDYTRGFSNNNNGYDQQRIDLLKHYADEIWSVNDHAYVILEHWADNSEELSLANYGMMIWANHNEQFNQNTLGYHENHDYSWAYYTERGYTYPNLIPYMESHDEERQMYRNLTYGNSEGDYDVTNLETGLERNEAITTMYYAVPGPKMIWQFGELGYDYSINHCPDGTISEDCRTAAKPVKWDYWNVYERQKLYQVYAGMAKLKTEQEAFQSGDFGKDLSGLVKRAWVSHSSMNVVVGANFDVNGHTVTPSFQNSGTWYNYFTGESFEVSDAGGHTVDLSAGEYYVYTSQEVERPFVNLTVNVTRDGSPVADVEVNLGLSGMRMTGAGGEAKFALASNEDVDYTILENGTEITGGTVELNEDDRTLNIQLEGNSVAEFNKNTLNVYPNPASESVTLESDRDGWLEIYTLPGKKVASNQIIKGKNDVDVSQLNRGVYLLKLISKGDVRTGKLSVE